jgi:hypothetical protein
MRKPLLILLLLVVSLVTTATATMTTTFAPTDTVIVNTTYILNTATGTPYDIWIYSIVAAIVLVLVSLIKFPHGEEGIVSVMAWFPSAFALFAAFNIDKITASGIMQVSDVAATYMMVERHTLYHFDLIAYSCLLPLLICTLLNTARIWLNMKAIRQVAVVDTKKVGESE